jgi:hypothetical protein
LENVYQHGLHELVSLADLEIELVECIAGLGVARDVGANSLETLNSVVYIVPSLVRLRGC